MITHNREYYVNGVFIDNTVKHVEIMTKGKYKYKGECILGDGFFYHMDYQKNQKKFTINEFANKILQIWLDSDRHRDILMESGKGYLSITIEKSISNEEIKLYEYDLYGVYIVCKWKDLTK